MILTSAIKD